MKRNFENYPITQSPLYRLKTKRKLAEILFTSVKVITAISVEKVYRCWDTKSKYPSDAVELRHKPRQVEQPSPGLAVLQRRAHDLLSRIELPEYLHSARKGRSYVGNALSHTGSGRAVRIDVRKFYRSASDKHIWLFYKETLKCSPDVAHLLTELTSYNRHIPTGSPLSPIISFFAYKPMFDALNALAAEIDAKMTVYIDDIVISGDSVDGKLIPKCKRVIKEFDLRGHKVAFFRKGAVRVITGAAVTSSGISLPHKRQRKIRALERELLKSNSTELRLLYLKAIVGQYREAKIFDSRFVAKAQSYADQLSNLQAEISIK